MKTARRLRNIALALPLAILLHAYSAHSENNNDQPPKQQASQRDRQSKKDPRRSDKTGGVGTRGGGDECRIEFHAFVVASAGWLSQNRELILHETHIDVGPILFAYERRGLRQKVDCTDDPVFDEFHRRVPAFSDSSTKTTRIYEPAWVKESRFKLTMHEVLVLFGVETTLATPITSLFYRLATSPLASYRLARDQESATISSAQNPEVICGGRLKSGEEYIVKVELDRLAYTRTAYYSRRNKESLEFDPFEVSPVADYASFFKKLGEISESSQIVCPVTIESPTTLPDVSFSAFKGGTGWQFRFRGRLIGEMLFNWLHPDAGPNGTSSEEFERGPWSCSHSSDLQFSQVGPHFCELRFRGGKFTTDLSGQGWLTVEYPARAQFSVKEDYLEIKISQSNGLSAFAQDAKDSQEVRCVPESASPGALSSLTRIELCAIRVFKDGHIEAPPAAH